MLDFDERYMVRKSYYLTGTGAMGQTLDAGDAVKVGSDSVKILCTGHGLPVGAVIFIAGTTNYNGYHTITAKGDDDFTFVATYEAETIASDDTLSHRLLPGDLARLIEIRLHLSVASAQADDLTIALDSGEDAVYDCIFITQDINGLADFPYVWGEANSPKFNNSLDALIFAWANKDSRTWGLEVIYDVMQATD